MNKTTKAIIKAFYNSNQLKVGNTRTDGTAIYLHDNKIAEKRNGKLFITNCQWLTQVTKERLNGLFGVNISQRKWVWYLNGEEWNGEWIEVCAIS